MLLNSVQFSLLYHTVHEKSVLTVVVLILACIAIPMILMILNMVSRSKLNLLHCSKCDMTRSPPTQSDSVSLLSCCVLPVRPLLRFANWSQRPAFVQNLEPWYQPTIDALLVEICSAPGSSQSNNSGQVVHTYVPT